jgi:hypothetical protein
MVGQCNKHFRVVRPLQGSMQTYFVIVESYGYTLVTLMATVVVFLLFTSVIYKTLYLKEKQLRGSDVMGVTYVPAKEGQFH